MTGDHEIPADGGEGKGKPEWRQRQVLEQEADGLWNHAEQATQQQTPEIQPSPVSEGAEDEDDEFDGVVDGEAKQGHDTQDQHQVLPGIGAVPIIGKWSASLRHGERANEDGRIRSTPQERGVVLMRCEESDYQRGMIWRGRREREKERKGRRRKKG